MSMTTNVLTYVESQVEMAKKEMAIEICTNILKDADGETMEAIVKGVRMEQQLLKQLLMSMKVADINYAMLEAGFKPVQK